ncbi:hypothetical protein [Bacillus sp. FJAT-50079]|uniref:hypothetical protein n=1 Tax=Bacillus sp. FJAT-50079 TaxID=2833577 RepID=UPI001BCA31A9|nr:hypothetical protein [Bacillus sp. FJAT-50079]MBS4207500.1 hypothetical protein [Bacillus sp. FJAT-50079]
MFDLLVSKNFSFNFLGIVPIIVGVFRMFVDHINIRPVEKILTSNVKKFYIEASNILFITLVYSLIIAAVMFFQGIQIKDIQQLFYYFFYCYALTFVFVFPLYLIIMFIVEFVSFKVRYYIYLDNIRDKMWFISRRINRKTILICDEYNNCKFLEVNNSYNNLTFYSIIQEKKPKLLKLYISIANKKKILMRIIGPVYVIILLLANYCKGNIKLQLLFYFTLVMLIIITFLIYVINKNITSLKGRSSSLNMRRRLEN